MRPFGSVLVDFDGTACLHDVAEHLLIEFGDPSWPELDDAWDRGELDSRRVITAQAGMLRAPLDVMVEFALEHCRLDPTFAPFVRWLEDEGADVSIVSDGFGFYIRPLLEAAGLERLRVITNDWGGDGDAPIVFTNGHDQCIGCGTCKMNTVFEARAHGPVVFVGEGASDRYGALYSDLVFAKDRLEGIAAADGIPFRRWTTFDDVREELASLDSVPGPVGKERCPGWRTP